MKNDRRNQVRKQGQFPGEIKDSSSMEDVTALRASPYKRTPQRMRANVLLSKAAETFEGTQAQCVVLDVSEKGLKISSAVKQLKPETKVGVFFEIPGDGGVTLICEVRWHQPWAKGFENWTGLKILSSTDDESFKAFVDELPPLEVKKK